MNPLQLVAAVLIVALSGAPAGAHAPIVGIGGFPGGLLHPILVPAHLLSLVALGLVVAQRRERIIAFLCFMIALIAGIVAIMFGVGATPAPIVMLVNTAVMGVIVASAWTPPKPLAWLLAAVAGGALALDSPPDTVSIAEGDRMLLGTGMGACAILAAMVAGAGILRRKWQALGARILGSWIAASALLVLALTLR